MNRYLLLLSLSLIPGWFGHEGAAAPSSEQAPRSLSGQTELREFLNCQLVPRLGNAWDYTFAPGKFPRIKWDRPEVVEKVMGSFPLKVRWFDGDGREVTSPDQPGRYAFYAEGTTTGGKTIRRAATLYCRPKEWDGWSEKPKAYIDFLPLDGLTRSAWDEHREAIAGFAGRTVLLSILRQEEGAVLMSYLHEIKSTGAKPALTDTPLIRDHEYHLALKRKILSSYEYVFPAYRLMGWCCNGQGEVRMQGKMSQDCTYVSRESPEAGKQHIGHSRGLQVLP